MKYALATFVLLLCPAPLFAQTSDEVERAAGHYEAGLAAFQSGDFDTAAAEFQLSYDLVPKPELLYNASFALARSGDIDAAREIARDAVVTRLPADIDAKFRARLHGWRTVEHAQNRPEPVVVVEAPPAEEPADVRVAPTPVKSAGPRGLRISSYIIGGVGLAGLATAGLMEIRLQAVGRDLDTAAARDDAAAYDAALESGRTFQNIGRVAVIAGGTLLLTGVVLWFVSKARPDDAARAVVRF